VSNGKPLAVLQSSPVPAKMLPDSSTFSLFAFAVFSPSGRYVVTSDVDNEPSVYDRPVPNGWRLVFFSAMGRLLQV
jgi:hypothetical protein